MKTKNKINEIVGKMRLEQQLDYYEGVGNLDEAKKVCTELFNDYMSKSISGERVSSDFIYDASALIKKNLLDREEVVKKGAFILEELLTERNLYYYPANIIVEKFGISEKKKTEIFERAFDNYVTKRDFRSALEIAENFSVPKDKHKKAAIGKFNNYMQMTEDEGVQRPQDYIWAAQLAEKYNLGEDKIKAAAEKGFYAFLSGYTTYFFEGREIEELREKYEISLDNEKIREIFKNHFRNRNNEAVVYIANEYNFSDEEKLKAAKLDYDCELEEAKKENRNAYHMCFNDAHYHYKNARRVAKKYNLGEDKVRNCFNEEFKIVLSGKARYCGINDARRIQLEEDIDVNNIVLGKLEEELSKNNLEESKKLIDIFELENLDEAQSYVQLYKVMSKVNSEK